MNRSQIEKEYYYYMTLFHKEIKNNNYLLKFLHIIHCNLYLILFFLVFRKKFNLCSIFFIILFLQWIVLKDECGINYLVKKILDKNYKLGQNYLMLEFHYDPLRIKKFNEIINDYSYNHLIYNRLKFIFFFIFILLLSNFKYKLLIILFFSYFTFKSLDNVIHYFAPCY